MEKSEKSTRWQFTAYEGDYALLDAHAETGNDLIAEIGWQDEICPKTQKKHRQGYVRTVRQVRFGQLKAIMGGIHLEKAKNWEALQNYCRKEETRDASGSQIQKTFARPMRLHEMLFAVGKRIRDQAEFEGKSLVGLDRQTDRQSRLQLLRLWSIQLVRQHPEYAAVLCRQDARDAWCDYFTVWLDLEEARAGPQ